VLPASALSPTDRALRLSAQLSWALAIAGVLLYLWGQPWLAVWPDLPGTRRLMLWRGARMAGFALLLHLGALVFSSPEEREDARHKGYSLMSALGWAGLCLCLYLLWVPRLNRVLDSGPGQRPFESQIVALKPGPTTTHVRFVPWENGRGQLSLDIPAGRAILNPAQLRVGSRYRLSLGRGPFDLPYVRSAELTQPPESVKFSMFQNAYMKPLDTMGPLKPTVWL
jgi:hypothetical protein